MKEMQRFDIKNSFILFLQDTLLFLQDSTYTLKCHVSSFKDRLSYIGMYLLF